MHLLCDTRDNNDLHTVIVLSKNFTVFATSCFNAAYVFHKSTPIEKIYSHLDLKKFFPMVYNLLKMNNNP